jgi:hypothetical protein
VALSVWMHSKYHYYQSVLFLTVLVKVDGSGVVVVR